jgi:hypothetical protein
VEELDVEPVFVFKLEAIDHDLGMTLGGGNPAEAGQNPESKRAESKSHGIRIEGKEAFVDRV